MTTTLVRPKRRVRTVLAALVIAVAALAAVSSAFANAGNPDSVSATWQYVSGTSGPVSVSVSGTWDWGSNSVKDGGHDAQSCAQGPSVSQTDINGHYAVGVAVAWGDSSTPNKLSAHGQSIMVGNAMDWLNASYCAGTTASAPYPSGSFSATHQYASYSAFQQDTSNGQLCVNAYDVHQNGGNDLSPVQNGDNTLNNGLFDPSVDCASAQDVNPPPPPTTPTPTTPTPTTPTPTTPTPTTPTPTTPTPTTPTTTTPTPTTPTTTTPNTPSSPTTPSGPSTPSTPSTPTTPSTPGTSPNTPAPTASIAIVKRERVGSSGTYVRGPLSARLGDVLDYEIVVTNTGGESLTVDLADPRCDAGTLSPSGPQTLAAGAARTYTCSHRLLRDDVGSFVNTATASATTPSGQRVGPASSRVSASVSIVGVLGARVVLVHKAAKVHRTLKHRAAPKRVVRVKRHTVVKHVKVAAHVKAIKKVTKVAKPAKALVESASFTG